MTAAEISGVEDILLMENINHFPYIDQDILFDVFYSSPLLIITHRTPMVVAYSLQKIFF